VRRFRRRLTKRRDPWQEPDDGLIATAYAEVDKFGIVRRFQKLVTPEELQEAARERMLPHDKRPLYERWGGNQWGEGWVHNPLARRGYERQAPPLLTDPPLAVYEEIHDASRNKGRKGRKQAKRRIWHRDPGGAE
jgi:hypothetical protein